MIRYMHFRDRSLIDGSVDNRGGATVAYEDGPHGFEFAVARCSWRDNFCRSVGRTKAAGRLRSSRFRQRFSSHDEGEFYRVMNERYLAGVLDIG